MSRLQHCFEGFRTYRVTSYDRECFYAMLEKPYHLLADIRFSSHAVTVDLGHVFALWPVYFPQTTKHVCGDLAVDTFIQRMSVTRCLCLSL